jgi:hypothetical protein
MLMIKLLTISHGLLPHRYSSQARERDDESSIDLSMFNIEDDKSCADLKIFDTEYDKSSDPDDCCHYITKVSTTI